jgi:hypothetical protein
MLCFKFWSQSLMYNNPFFVSIHFDQKSELVQCLNIFVWALTHGANVCSTISHVFGWKFFQPKGVPYFGNPYIVFLLTKFNDSNNPRCARRWASTSIWRSTLDMQQPRCYRTLSPKVYGHKLLYPSWNAHIFMGRNGAKRLSIGSTFFCFMITIGGVQ